MIRTREITRNSIKISIEVVKIIKKIIAKTMNTTHMSFRILVFTKSFYKLEQLVLIV